MKKEKKESEEKKAKSYSNEQPFIYDLIPYTPARLKREIADLEVKFNIQTAIIFYMLSLAIAGIFCYLYHLKIQYWILPVCESIFFAPILMMEFLRGQNERRKFSDVNSYAQQFISGMQLKHKIIPAIENTLFTFPNGRMHDVLMNALRYIQTQKDPMKAQAEALYYIDNMYPNMQTPTIHDFAKRIETTGGNFEQEMNLLNKKREKWEKRIEHEQNATKTSLIGAVIMFLAMMMVDVFVVQSLPENLSILEYDLVQIPEMVLIMIFYPFVYSCLRTHRTGWMTNETSMDEAEATKNLDYLENYNPKKERKKGFIAGGIALAATIILTIIFKNPYVAVVGAILTIIGFNIHSIIRWATLKKVRKEMTRAIPKWLFDVCLCMQKSSIVESVERSSKTAAPILRRDIERFLSDLNRAPESVEPYLNFLLPYGIPNINATMRALLSIQNGTGGNSDMQMQQLIEHNLNLLDEQDEAEEEVRRLSSVKYTVFSSIPASAVMLFYLFAIIVKVFDLMATLM